jgi:lysophospholipase L1-like esterase
MQFGTSASNMGDYNANSKRKTFGNILAGDQVTTVGAMVPLAAHQWMLCTGFQALLIKPVYNHGMFGDSITKGSGSFDTNNGLWGWAHRAPQALTDAGLGTHSVVNYGASGQSKIWTNAVFLTVIREANLDTAIMFPWSPNNAGASSPWALNDFMFQVFAAHAECRKYGTALIVATQPPASFITDVPGDLIRKANNAKIRELTAYGITVADFDAVLTNTASPARFAPGLTADQVHPNSAGYAAMAQEYERAIREALGL